MRYNKIIILACMMLTLVACESSEEPAQAISTRGLQITWTAVPTDTPLPTKNLPQHTIESNTSLAPKDGRRIEIHVRNTNLTKDECRLLINAYKQEAGPIGQVSVRKPNKNGELLPWCVDNIDDKGTTFNDFHFE